MTANHEHTPTVNEIRQAYFEYRSVFGFYDPAIYDEFNKWLEAHNARIEAAAEQRGAARGWDEVADNLGEYAEVDDSLIHLADNIRGANPYRAGKEGDDG